MQRLLAASWLAQGKTTLINPGNSADDLAALDIIKSLGSQVVQKDNILEIDSTIRRFPLRVHAGESGLSSRMFSVLLSSLDRPVTILGEGTLLTRDFSPLREIYEAGKVEYQWNDNHLPVTLCGPIQPGEFNLDGSHSSQFITGLLMILPTLKGDSTVVVNNPKSVGYLEITLEVMKLFGVLVERSSDFTLFRIKGNQKYKGSTIEVEADWSGGAFLLVAAALLKNHRVSGLSWTSVQPDSIILKVLQKAGMLPKREEGGIAFESAKSREIRVDLTHAPDLFPPVVLLSLFTEGHHIISGVHRLPGKESDRGNVMVTELSKCGQSLWIDGDDLHVEGNQPFISATTDSKRDHRMAMLLGLASKISGVKLEIVDPQCVSKSFPNFWEVIDKL